MEQSPNNHEPPIEILNPADPWAVVWREEFKGNTLNETFWNPLDDAHGHGTRNQHYKPDNLEVADGLLTIHLKQEQSGRFPYTSGALTTKDKVAFQYGKLEVRAKLPGGKGLLPAIWLWNTAGKDFPEIDIAEINGEEPEQLWNVVHYDQDGIHERDYTMNEIPGLTDDFQVYGIEWDEERIVFLLNGKPVFTSTEYIPKEDMYLFINAAIGGTWIGEPDNTTVFPSTMQIDWIRYSKKY